MNAVLVKKENCKLFNNFSDLSFLNYESEQNEKNEVLQKEQVQIFIDNKVVKNVNKIKELSKNIPEVVEKQYFQNIFEKTQNS